MITDQQKRIIQHILEPFLPNRIGIFGSVARGEATQTSDLDILVDFNSRISLFDLIDLEEKLSDALHCKVDLVTERSLHPSIKQFIDKDIVFID